MNRSRLPIVIVLIVALALSGVARKLTLDQRARRDIATGRTGGGTNLGQLNSFALGLLLGGLRGPLVILLWTSSEDQKTNRDLRDFDSKVELIRQLQPEFVTVHLFQIWNKAYNVSVLMANLPNKYTTILDSLTYADSVDREMPDDVNIVSQTAGIYFDKLGNSAEKEYYRQRLRDESRADEPFDRVTFPTAKKDGIQRIVRLAGADPISATPRPVSGDPKQMYVNIRQRLITPVQDQLVAAGATVAPRAPRVANASDETLRRTEHPQLLDANGMLLPEYVKPRYAGADGYDGSPLYFLKPFQPFPFGVTPTAIGYAYYKRAQWLQEERKQVPVQLSPRVISSRPALTLQKWADEEQERGRRAEALAYDLVAPKELPPLDRLAATLPVAPPKQSTPLIDQAIAAYDRAAQVGRQSLVEFDHHFKSYSGDILQYQSHRAATLAQADLNEADRDFLKAALATGDERVRLARAAADAYGRSADGFTRHLLQYYVPDEQAALVLPPLSTRRPDSLAKLGRPQLESAMANIERQPRGMQNPYGNSEEVESFGALIFRARARAATLNRLAGTAAPALLTPSPSAPAPVAPAVPAAPAALPATRPAA